MRWKRKWTFSRLPRESWQSYCLTASGTPESRLGGVCRSRIELRKFGLRYDVSQKVEYLLKYHDLRVSLTQLQSIFGSKCSKLKLTVIGSGVISTLEHLFYVPNRTGPIVNGESHRPSWRSTRFRTGKWISTIQQTPLQQIASNASQLRYRIRYTQYMIYPSSCEIGLCQIMHSAYSTLLLLNYRKQLFLHTPRRHNFWKRRYPVSHMHLATSQAKTSLMMQRQSLCRQC